MSRFAHIMKASKNKGRGKPENSSEKKVTTGMTREEAFSYVPVKSRDVVETRLESGDVVLEYPTTVKPLIAGIMKKMGRKAPPVHKKKIQLDTLGTAAWDLIDGQRTVGRLIKTFTEQYRLHPREAETSITQFIRELGRRGLIGLS